MKLIGLLHHFDQNVTLALNSVHTPFTDAVWVMFSDRKVWMLMYLVLAILLFCRTRWKKALIILISVALTVLACDQFANLIKDSVARLRPMWDNYMIEGGLRRLEGRSGFYGFFSAHSANAFGTAICVLMGFRTVDKSRKYDSMGLMLFIWAALVGISRVFVGKHFLGDVFVGACVGLLFGWIFGRIARWVIDKYSLSL